MSGIQNKNLIFYSLYPNDVVSRMCLEELNKNPALNKQFIRICVHHPQDVSKPPLVTLPALVNQYRSMIPILAISGFKQPIFAKAAVSWIRESALKDQNSGGLAGSNIHGGGIADNSATIAQSEAGSNSLFDTDFNISWSNGIGEFNKMYANIDEAAQNRITVFEDSSDKKSLASNISQKLEQLKNSRLAEVSMASPYGGGTAPGMPQMPGAPPGMPGMQQRMPQMPQMPVYR
jgi:hypothetical protein